MPTARLAAVVVAIVAVSGSLASPSSAERAPSVPVPSLEPAKTEALWRSLVNRRPRDLRAQAACRPLRAVFYAASDWLRLATKLASAASPCAEYYVSVPPLVADKTTFRRNQASRIRALGPNFHATAEIHFATWTRWVQSTGNTWHAAGVTARERMAEAGYDVALGDTWALNELTSAVRRGDGDARANIREFLRGLYEGDGSRPTRGAALVIGFGQRTGDVSVYQDTLQNWLSDAAFWTDMTTYVSDWSQEVYGDLRSHAVPGQPVSARREYLNDYLQHKLVLASVGPSTIEPARAYLRDAYSPLANAAWPRETAWGWTMVPAEQMAAYISAQVNAMRYFSASSGQARDHWGFAWAPRNTMGLSNADFAAQTGQLLDRLAASIRDSGNVAEPENPGSGACGPPGQETFCLVDLAEARHTESWRSFRTWTQATISIGNGAQTLPAGTPSAPMTVTLVTPSGLPVSVGASRVVTLASSSPQGTFSTSPAGPWTSTLALTAAPGTTVTFYYRDTLAGRHTLTASGQGVTAATQVVTVVAGPAVAIAVSPSQSTVVAQGTRRLAAAATDAFGNATAATIAWSVAPAALGSVSPGPGGAAVFTARRVLGSGAITASAGGLAGTAAITVLPGTLRIASLKVTPTSRGLRVLVGTADGARRPISRATLTVVVQKDRRRVFRDRAVTGSGGKALFRVRIAKGCYRVVLTRAAAQGFRWTGATPSRRVCRR